MSTEKKKLFVGGLPEDVTEEILKKKFKSYGDINSVVIHRKKSLTDNTINVFAFVTIDISQQNLNKCIYSNNDSTWKGKTLKISVARENFLDRLAAERKENAIVREWSQNADNKPNCTEKTKVVIDDKNKNKVLKYVSDDDDEEDSSSEDEVEVSKDEKASKIRKASSSSSDDDDDDDDDDEEDEEAMTTLETEEDMLAEKKKNLEILSSIIGKKPEKRKLASSMNQQSSMMQRYDPSKPGHEEFEVQGQSGEDDEDGSCDPPTSKKVKMEVDNVSDSSDDGGVSKEVSPKKTLQNDDATPQAVDSKKFSEVSSSVVDAFKKTEAFKLSSLFGNDDDEEEDEDGGDNDAAARRPSAKRPKLMTDMFGWDKEESDDDDDDDDDVDRSDDEGRKMQKRRSKVDAASSKKQKTKNKKSEKPSKFFFEASDSRLTEGSTFHRQNDVEELRKKWEQLRPQCVDSYKLRKKRYRMGKSKM